MKTEVHVLSTAHEMAITLLAMFNRRISGSDEIGCGQDAQPSAGFPSDRFYAV